MNNLRRWISLIESTDIDQIIHQMMRLLNSDTRHEPEEAEQEIAELKDKIPTEYRVIHGVLWRSAGISLADAHRFLAGHAVVTMSRRFASWTQERSNAAQFLEADAQHPVALYRSSIDPQSVVFNAATVSNRYKNYIPHMVGEVIIEMTPRLATVSMANTAALAVTKEQYKALTGKEASIKSSSPHEDNYILRFSGGKIARIDTEPGYRVFGGFGS